MFYPQFIGTSPMGTADWMNRYTEITGTTYGYRFIDEREVSGALRDVVTAVEQGHPVPILAGGTYPAHYVTVVGHQDGNLHRATYFDQVQAVIVPQR